MQLNLTTLLKLPVFTESGAKLGRVYDGWFDVEEQIITGYSVRPHALSRQSLLIKPAQVKSITKEKMIVDDAVLKEAKRAPEQKAASPVALSGALPRLRLIKAGLPRSNE